MEKQNLPLCDAHVHIFPEKLFQAILGWFDRVGWNIPYRWPPEKHREFLQEIGVKKAFLLVYAHKPDISAEINRWVRDFTSGGDFFYPFGCVHPGDRGLSGIIKRALDEFGFYGFKLQLLVTPFRPDDERLFPIYEGVLERGKAVVIHATSFPFPEEHLKVKYMERLLSRYPRLKLVIPHLGFYENRIYAELMEEYPGLYLDTAFVLGEQKKFPLPKEEIKWMLQRFPGRILYGSDYPILENHAEKGLEYLRHLKLSEDVLRQILWENAHRFLGFG